MKLIAWKDLTPDAKRQVKAAFVHWNHGGTPSRTVDGKTFEQWASEHAFYIRKDGHLAMKPGHCEPAWMADRG